MNRRQLKVFLDDTIKEINNFKEISQHSYIILFTLFGSTLAHALELVDKEWITKYRSKESRRAYYKIIDLNPDMRALLSSKNSNNRKRLRSDQLDNAQDEYVVLEDTTFCPCYTHLKEVMTKKSIMCKHILALQLCKALRIFKETVLLEEDEFLPSYLDSGAHFKTYIQPKTRVVKTKEDTS